MCTAVFQTIVNLACTYCGRNDTAREELIEIGYETVLEFAAGNLVTDENQLEEGKRLLTAELMDSEEFSLEIYGILKNRLRNYAKSMSERSPVFRRIYPARFKRRITTVFYGSFAEKDDEKESESEMSREYCPVELEDNSCLTDREMAELLFDASRFLDAEELEILEMRLEGRSIKEIAMVYGVTTSAICQRIKTIAKKLKPLYESLKNAA